MKNTFLAGMLLTLLGFFSAPANAVVTNVYSNISCGSPCDGSPFSGFVGSISTPDINFGTSTGFNWHPFGLPDFSSDSLGTISVGATGAYLFSLTSDDGSTLYIDGSLVINNGGPHGPSTASNVVLLGAGLHSLEVRFFECCGGPSGLDLSLPSGVIFTAAVPEPSTWAMMLIGFAGVGFAAYRRRKSRAGFAI